MEISEATKQAKPEYVPFRERAGCTIKEACEFSSLKPATIYELIADGTLKSTKVGRRRIIMVESLRKLVEKTEAA